MKQDYTTILLEEIRDQNKAILEGQKDQASRADIRRLEQDIAELKDDMEVVKAVVKSTNRDVVALDRRVTRLEAA
jgi:polyhydroxyalkanoate synthesis regulator phasin